MVKDKDNVLGERLANLRESHDWSKTQVANKIGLSSMQKYANYEYGVRQPDFDTLVKLADLFEVTTDYLLGNSRSKKNIINEVSAPSWATDKDINDLHNFLAENGQMTYKGMDLTKEQRERVDQIITQVFWEELEKDKRKNER